MLTCEHCLNILFDSVYGLLEENELQEMRAHLNTCSSCQAALETVRAQQNLLARATRAIREVPEFSLPTEETATLPQDAPVETAVTTPVTSTVPIHLHPSSEHAAPSLPSQRSYWRRPWVAWATAAAILLAVGTSVSLYRHTLHTLQGELTAQRQEQTKVDQQIAALPAKYQALQHAAAQNVRAKTSPHVHIVGPTQLQPDAKASLHVTTRQVEGELAPAKVHVKLMEAGTDRIIQQTQVDSTGQARVELNAVQAQPGVHLNLSVEAETAGGKADMQEAIQTAAPGYVARIDTNKMVYPIRDVLFFRVLVLDRYSLKPPNQPVMLHVKLLNPKNDIVRQEVSPSGDGGVLAGEWSIEERFLAGPYVMQVGLIAGATAPVQMASQRLEVVRDLRAPDIQFDRQHYLPGEVLSGVLPGPSRGAGAGGGGGFMNPVQALGKIGNQAVPVTIQPQPAAAPMIPPVATYAATDVQNRAENKRDAKKSTPDTNAMGLRRFHTQVPEKLPVDATRVPFNIQLQDGKHKEEFKGFVPLSPTDYTIDFFPEGGDLIAGVVNRVFYRVRTRAGESATGDGRVILMTSKNEIVDSPYQLGLGYLDFTPHANETYTVRITSKMKINEVVQPFARFGIRTSGVVLHVPDAVGKQGEPIRIKLRNQGPVRPLMLVAQCRGQIVDQRWFDIQAGSQDCTLETSEARGMIRVTAYQVEGETLEPVAERLVYRVPAQRLDLSMTLNTQQYQPGSHIDGRITAHNEKGAPENAWTLASVVDERFQARPRSLSAHFLLLNEIHSGADLDDATLVLRDSPESVQMLERFLGTHGWRRFEQTGQPMALALGRFAKGAAQNTAALKIFSRENMPLEAVQKQYAEQLAQALTPLNQAAFAEQIEAEEQRQRSAEAVHQAAVNLRNFEEMIQLGTRISLGMFVAVMLGISLILMGAGAYRIIRGHQTGVPAFGGAFACLAVCLVTLLLGRSIGPIDSANPTLPTQHVAKNRESEQKRDQPLAQAALERNNEPAPAGAFAIPAPQRDGVAHVETEKTQRENRSQMATSALREQLTQALDDRPPSAVPGGPARHSRVIENKMMRSRFENARPALAQMEAVDASSNSIPLAPSPARAKVDAIGAADIAKAKPSPGAAPPAHIENPKQAKAITLEKSSRKREYAHQHAPNLIADTLLWSPTLYLTNGVTDVHFDIASGQATYRVLLLGHTSTGRFGYYESRLDVPAVGN